MATLSEKRLGNLTLNMVRVTIHPDAMLAYRVEEPAYIYLNPGAIVSIQPTQDGTVLHTSDDDVLRIVTGSMVAVAISIPRLSPRAAAKAPGTDDPEREVRV